MLITPVLGLVRVSPKAHVPPLPGAPATAADADAPRPGGTTLKIAFGSCFDAVDDQQQTSWNHVAELAPDVLLLLGDTVYMDFGLGILGSHRPLGWPRKATNEVFARSLYERYRQQWAVPAFRGLLARGVKVGLTWDDHDFAWNNSRGAGTAKHFAVP